MADIHLLAAQLALVLAVLATAWTVALALTRRQAGTMLYGLLLWVVIALAGAGLVGVVTALTIAPPADALHLLYGVLAFAALPGGVLIARDRPPRQRATILAITLVVLAILVVRLFQTGS